MNTVAQSPLVADPMPFGGQTFAVMILAIAILAALSWLLRRSAKLRRPGQLMSVETTLPLGERRSLVVVAIEGRRLLVGMTPGQISLVAELEPGFRDTLDQSIGRTADPQPGS